MENMGKRKVDIVVLSDVHLGTYGCHAEELLKYLKSIQPGRLILNGDIIDIWNFSKRYWPQSHMKVVKRIVSLMAKGVKVTYITGNHDEMLRKFVGLKVGKMTIKNKTVLKLDNGKKAWIFHGDVFDVTMQYSKWLAKLGGHGYDLLILINRFINYVSVGLGRGKISLSKKIKDSVKSAVKFINDFEKTAADIGISNGYDYVVCGHIHQPEIKQIDNDKGSITYMNSGDWIENLTALEYNDGEWSIFKYNEADYPKEEEVSDPDQDELFKMMLAEFSLTVKK
jgi:UDP-2,3-diacylglucosamine pyrophosphatase LpxH